ncbi:YrhB domain-containing protein [Duganella sp. CT11-25]|jgi:hypothetical protein|uniref:YrhB domain-containing protein n=1 Tax=unclassified Duganella TaxID=2636909 RepID=UPI0039B0596B
MDTINHSAALKIAQAKVRELALASGDEFEILSGETREMEQGWVFFFNSSDYVRTQDSMSALAGNGPLLVLRSGQVAMLPASVPWQEAVMQIHQLNTGWAA